MTRLISFMVMLFPFIIWANNQTVYYEPDSVMLTGVIKILTLPGPPNYTNIKDGDTAETGGYLLLTHPIDLEVAPGTTGNTNNSPERNVSLIQLVVLERNDWNKIREGDTVRITGTLFHALTGHHHTRILINLKKIDFLSHQTTQDKQQLTPEDKQFLKNQPIK